MNQLDVVRGFQEYGDSRSPSPEALAAQFLKTIEPLGFRHFACCSHVDPSRPPVEAVMLHNYPPAWVRTFSEARLYEIDPVLRRAESSRLPFFWDTAFAPDRLTLSQQSVLAEAASYGLAHGYTVPLHLSWVAGSFPASCSLIPDSGGVDPEKYLLVELLAEYLYLFASQAHAPWLAVSRVELTARERQCLELVVQGKSDWAIGRILGISTSTAHSHVESAKRRFGVTTRQQAVAHACMSGQISCRGLARRMGAAPARPDIAPPDLH
ncbi:MAG TPA: LuxR family transcriptional regulator [Steroidobacteraceae bacterium]|nr:LuxR family transcriptional regulator [Steroidobacteraceae bacterium]